MIVLMGHHLLLRIVEARLLLLGVTLLAYDCLGYNELLLDVGKIVAGTLVYDGPFLLRRLRLLPTPILVTLQT